MNEQVKDRLATEFSALWFAGRCPVSGTVGSAVAVALAPLLFLPLPGFWRVVFLLALFVLGGMAGTRVERLQGKKDPGIVVMDELIGQWLTFLPFAALSFGWLVTGFVLFRIFDITKPPPIRASENWLPGGYGIMIDDVLAGVYALLALWVLRLLFGA